MFYNTPANFLSHLPERLQGVIEFGVLADAVNPELDGVNAAVGTMVANVSISTANAAGLSRWEAVLGVSTPLNGTLKARREALKARLMTKPPINLETLRGIIETYMGVQVELGLDNSVVSVVYRGTSKVADLRPLYTTIYETIPASLLVQIAYKYLIWYELDAQGIIFSVMDAKGLDWNTLERGEWIG
ncbi:MAG: putative phage tail protein [Candidatus Fimivivens sp.]|nr:putative phage tail protein [Candidatus Fimivivens sp.]